MPEEPVPDLTDERAMDLIAEAMSGAEWDADLWDDIASIVRETGREIRDWTDVDDEPAVLEVELP